MEDTDEQRRPGTVNVASVIDVTEAEGPGRRFAVWVQGCPMRCPGCCNPDLLLFAERSRVDPGELAARAVASGAEGVSILGGEPFAQAGPLAEFASACREAGMSVMAYSGYTLEELRASADPGVAALLAACDLLVDGRYVESLRATDARWVGSSNQRMHFLTGRYSPSDPRFREPNTLEIRVSAGGVSINGWPVTGASTGSRVTGGI